MKQKLMRMSPYFLTVLLCVLTILILIEAQDQSGFISIDCALPEKSSYAETTTGINYISDAKFIDTDVSIRIPPVGDTVLQQLEHVRSFPSGVGNCYKIDVTNGTKYLIKASFYYGNYDDQNDPPQFDLHFGPNMWDMVKFTNLSRIASMLSSFFRFDLGSITNLEYRYKDDDYDRVWFPFKWDEMKKLSSNEDILTQNIYKPPGVVMSTAVTPFNKSAPIQFNWNSDNLNDQYYSYLHFTEVEKLAENETRAFNITVNGVLMYGPEIPAYRSVDTIFSTVTLTRARKYIFSLTKTQNSTLPPIINAFEVYKLIDFSLSETNQDDVNTITSIKEAYGVARNWEGDPCGSVKYMWEGLNCSIGDSSNPPRITSFNLSSSGLTGQIVSSISKLSMLQNFKASMKILKMTI